MQSARPEPSAALEDSASSASPEQTSTVKTTVVASDDATPTPGNDTRFPVTFTGSGGEYFRIWIVNVLLSIVTLYVYSAWAKVRTKRYFAGNTQIDGSAFEYHATGMQIFLGRLIALAFFVVVVLTGQLHPLIDAVNAVFIMLILPWVVWRSMQFSLRMASYRNVRFGFEGTLGGAYMTLLVWPLLPLFIGAFAAGAVFYFLQSGAMAAGTLAVAGLATILIAPLAHRHLAHYSLNGSRYGKARFVGQPSTSRFYGIYLKVFGITLLLSLVVSAVAAALLAAQGLLSPESLAAAADNLEDNQAAGLLAPVLISYAILFLGGFLVKAYMGVRIRQHLLSQTVLDGQVNFESTMRVMPLTWLIVSNLLLLIITLGLAWPWTKVRMARYEAENTVLHSANGLHAVVDGEQARQSSIGEEVGDALDIDLGAGF